MKYILFIIILISSPILAVGEPDGDPGDGIDPNEAVTLIETQTGNNTWVTMAFGWAGNYLGSFESNWGVFLRTLMIGILGKILIWKR